MGMEVVTSFIQSTGEFRTSQFEKSSESLHDLWKEQAQEDYAKASAESSKK